jgi:hypothetical protein
MSLPFNAYKLTSCIIGLTVFMLCLLSGCEASGISGTQRATFKLQQGQEYCRIVKLPLPTRPPGAENINYFFGDLIAHLAPEYPNSVVLTHQGSQSYSRDGRFHSTNSIVVDFTHRSVFSVPRDHARWASWQPVGGNGGYLSGSALRDVGASEILAPPESILYSKDGVAIASRIRSFGLRGQFDVAKFSPRQAFVQVWSEGTSFGVRRATTGKSFLDIFRVRDGKRLVQAEYERYLVSESEWNLAAGVMPSDTQYFLPLWPLAETGMVCNFPPELFR